MRSLRPGAAARAGFSLWSKSRIRFAIHLSSKHWQAHRPGIAKAQTSRLAKAAPPRKRDDRI